MDSQATILGIQLGLLHDEHDRGLLLAADPANSPCLYLQTLQVRVWVT
jgi:hypothetical protein